MWQSWRLGDGCRCPQPEGCTHQVRVIQSQPEELQSQSHPLQTECVECDLEGPEGPSNGLIERECEEDGEEGEDGGGGEDAVSVSASHASHASHASSVQTATSASSTSAAAIRRNEPPEARCSRLCSKVRKLLSASPEEPLSVADHRKAAMAMAELAQLMANSDARHLPGERTTRTIMNSAALVALRCAGMALSRRIVVKVDSHETQEALQTTRGLLLALVVSAENPENRASDEAAWSGEAREGTDSRLLVDEFHRCTLAETMGVAQGKPPRSSWAAAVCRPEYQDALKQAIVNVTCPLVIESSSTNAGGEDEADAAADAENAEEQKARAEEARREEAFKQLCAQAELYFQIEQSRVAQRLLVSKGVDSEYVSMAAMAAIKDGAIGPRLAALVDTAESELGQAVMRDIQLSFLLPRAVVKVRRGLLLDRDTNAIITADYAEVLNEAHASALRGSVWEFEHNETEVGKMSAVLAGLAIAIGRDGDLRKDDAFLGRVRLPFFETNAPTGRCILTLSAETDEWLVYVQHANNPIPEVHLRAKGYDGFLRAVLVAHTATVSARRGCERRRAHQSRKSRGDRGDRGDRGERRRRQRV